MAKKSGPLFPLGQVVATPAALDAIYAAGDDVTPYLLKHSTLDPGNLGKEDVAENWFSLEHGFRILSAYTLSDATRIWIITEADRSSTCVLLPDEY
jgi:hypothetical protein